MIARHTGYGPGVFSHFVANEQIYDRHLEAAEEMIYRYQDRTNSEGEKFEDCNPKLVLNPNKTNFYDFTIDDFTLENYVAIKPQLKLELGI